MSVLGLIPARGGSKRIPHKNLRYLRGIPLIGWTIICARKADVLDRIVVSSDDAEILRIAASYGAETLDRPAEHATDEADSYGVIRHALETLDEDFEHVCLLQPTSPFRDPVDIIECLLSIGGGPAVVSVQEGRDVPNGAVYVGQVDWLLTGGNFDTPGLKQHVMPAERSHDLDTFADWAQAEALLNGEKVFV